MSDVRFSRSIRLRMMESKYSNKLCSNNDPIGCMDVTDVFCCDLAVGASIMTTQSASFPMVAFGKIVTVAREAPIFLHLW